MIGWLSGVVVARDPAQGVVVLNVGGVGYEVRVSMQTLASVGDLDELAAQPVRGVHPRKVSTSQQLDAAMEALTRMTHPQAAASATLAPHARAMTDVTGFGLLGHLMEILQASNCAATLQASQIPLLLGAAALAAAGHASSIAPANRAALLGRVTGKPSPLLYDPQTAGGLLAVVPADLADFLLTRLRVSDPDAAMIGQITAGTPSVEVA